MEQPPLDVEALIAEVAKRHKILLAPDDPALALITLNELALSHVLAILDAKLEDLEQRLSRISVLQTETAKAIGESIITAGAVYVARRLEEASASLASRNAKTKDEGTPVRFRVRLYFFAAIVSAFACGLAVSALLR